MKKLALLAFAISSCFSAVASEASSAPSFPSSYRSQSSGLEVDRVAFFTNLAVDYVHANYTKVPMTGHGVDFKVEFGAKIPVGHGKSNSFLSVSLCYMSFDLKNAFSGTDNVGAPVTINYTNNFTNIGLPISYTSILPSNRNASLYWQAGVNINYQGEVTQNDVKVTSQYAPITIYPFASTGISGSFDTHRRYGVKKGRVLIGPYFSYCATNMYKNNLATMHNYMVGLQYTVIWL